MGVRYHYSKEKDRFCYKSDVDFVENYLKEYIFKILYL